jgi:hypothetical protein
MYRLSVHSFTLSALCLPLSGPRRVFAGLIAREPQETIAVASLPGGINLLVVGEEPTLTAPTDFLATTVIITPPFANTSTSIDVASLEVSLPASVLIPEISRFQD